MINLFTSLIAQISGVLQAGISVAAVAWVAIVWWRSKALVNTLSAIVLAGVVVWATANVDFLQSRVGEDATGTGAPQQVTPDKSINELLGG